MNLSNEIRRKYENLIKSLGNLKLKRSFVSTIVDMKFNSCCNLITKKKISQNHEEKIRFKRKVAKIIDHALS